MLHVWQVIECAPHILLPQYPYTWEGLVKWLKNEELNFLAEKILQAAKDTNSTLYDEEED